MKKGCGHGNTSHCDYFYDIITGAYLPRDQVTLQHVHAMCNRDKFLELSGLGSVSDLSNLVFMHHGGHIAADEGSLMIVPIEATEANKRVVKVRQLQWRKVTSGSISFAIKKLPGSVLKPRRSLSWGIWLVPKPPTWCSFWVGSQPFLPRSLLHSYFSLTRSSGTCRSGTTLAAASATSNARSSWTTGTIRHIVTVKGSRSFVFRTLTVRYDATALFIFQVPG